MPLTLGQLREYLKNFPEDDDAVVRIETPEGFLHILNVWFDNDTSSLNFNAEDD